MTADIRTEILQIVEQNPKHYTIIIRKNELYMNWINEHKQTHNPLLSAQIYSAIYNISDRCENNNIKKFDRWSTGFTGCGPASVCKCTKDNISKNVSNTKNKLSDEEHKIINEKRNKTMISKYGVVYNSQRPEVKEVLSKPKIDYSIYKTLSDNEWLTNEYLIKKRTSVDIGKELGIDYSTVLSHLRKQGFETRQRSMYSMVEIEIYNYISDLSIIVEQNVRNIIPPYELDLYIKEKNIAIEVNGLYWHSFHPSSGKKENKKQHINKTIECEKLGIQLIHITDYEWINKQDIIKSLLRSKLGLNERIYARNCEIKEVSTNDAKSFLEQYHLQGFIGSTYYTGLYHNSELQMIMTFGKNRYGDGVELHRMCSKSGITVVGGIGKILKYFTHNHNIDKIVTYCDYSKTNGVGYENAGFVKQSITDLGYFWTDGTNTLSRYSTQKKKLKKILGDNFDENLSESINMFNAKYRRYWDCGNILLEYTQK